MRVRSRRGLTMLEVLVALVILGLGGIAWVSLLAQSTRTARDLILREHAVGAAASQLARMSLLPREPLLAYQATSVARVHAMDIGGSLIEVQVTDSAGRPLLHTSFYRRGAHGQ